MYTVLDKDSQGPIIIDRWSDRKVFRLGEYIEEGNYKNTYISEFVGGDKVLLKGPWGHTYCIGIDELPGYPVKSPLSAVEFQEEKCKVEKKIINLLQEFNQLCVKNDFQLETLTINTSGTDDKRTFDIDLLIV